MKLNRLAGLSILLITGSIHSTSSELKSNDIHTASTTRCLLDYPELKAMLSRKQVIIDRKQALIDKFDIAIIKNGIGLKKIDKIVRENKEIIAIRAELKTNKEECSVLYKEISALDAELGALSVKILSSVFFKIITPSFNYFWCKKKNE